MANRKVKPDRHDVVDLDVEGDVGAVLVTTRSYSTMPLGTDLEGVRGAGRGLGLVR